MAKFSLILHGALTPGPEARDALRVALGAVLQFDASELDKTFASFPSVLRENLSQSEAERLKTSIEMFDGDVEIIPQDELHPDVSTSAPFETGTEADFVLSPSDEVEFGAPIADDAEETRYDNGVVQKLRSEHHDNDTSLELRDPEESIALHELEAERVGESVVAPIIAFELVDPNKPDVTETVATSTAGEARTGGVHSVGEHSSATATSDSLAAESNNQKGSGANAHHGGHQEHEDDGSSEFHPEHTYDPEAAENEWKQTPADWTPVSRQPREKKTAFSRPFLATATLLLLGIAYLLLAPKPEASSGMTLLIDIEDLLREQKQIFKEGRKNRAKSGDKTARIHQSIPFEKFYTSDISANEITGSMQLGRSARGFEIAAVSLSQREPPLPNKKEYIAGKRAQPWIRRFEAKRPISARTKNIDLGTGVAAVVDAINSRIVVEKAGAPASLIGTYQVRATFYPAENIVRGIWYLSNVPLPANTDANVLSVRDVEGDKYEVVATGAFEASITQDLPAPVRETEWSDD